MLLDFDARYAHRLAHDPELFDAMVAAKTVGELLTEERWLRSLRDDVYWRMAADAIACDAAARLSNFGTVSTREAYREFRLRDDPYEDYAFTRLDATLHDEIGLHVVFEQIDKRWMGGLVGKRIDDRRRVLRDGTGAMRMESVTMYHVLHDPKLWPWALAYEATMIATKDTGSDGNKRRIEELEALQRAFKKSKRQVASDVVSHGATLALDADEIGTYRRTKRGLLGDDVVKSCLITCANHHLTYGHPDLWFVSSGMLKTSERSVAGASRLLWRTVAADTAWMYERNDRDLPHAYSDSDSAYAVAIASSFASTPDEPIEPIFTTEHVGRSLTLDWRAMENDPTCVPALVLDWTQLETLDDFRVSESVELQRLHGALIEATIDDASLAGAARQLTKRRILLLMPFLRPEDTMRGRGYCTERELLKKIRTLLPSGTTEEDVRSALNDLAEDWGVKRCAFSLNYVPSDGSGPLTNVPLRCPLFTAFEKKSRGTKRKRSETVNAIAKRSRTAFVVLD